MPYPWLFIGFFAPLLVAHVDAFAVRCSNAQSGASWPMQYHTPDHSSFVVQNNSTPTQHWNISFKSQASAWGEIDNWYIVPRCDHLTVLGESYGPAQTQTFDVSYNGTVLSTTSALWHLELDGTTGPVTSADGFLLYQQQDDNHDQSIQAFDSAGHPLWKLQQNCGSLVVFDKLLYMTGCIGANNATVLAADLQTGQLVHSAAAHMNWTAGELTWLGPDRLLLITAETPAQLFAIDPTLQKQYWHRTLNASIALSPAIAVDTATGLMYMLTVSENFQDNTLTESLTCIDGNTGGIVWHADVPMDAKATSIGPLFIAVVPQVGVAVTAVRIPAGNNNLTLVSFEGIVQWTVEASADQIAAFPSGHVAFISVGGSLELITRAHVYDRNGTEVAAPALYSCAWQGYCTSSYMFYGDTQGAAAVLTVGAVVDEKDQTQAVHFSSTPLLLS